MPSATRRVIVASRASEWQQMLARHGTAGQARFFLESRGQDADELVRRHRSQVEALELVERSIPTSWRRARITRPDFAGFLFEPDDVVVAVGQDGLIPNLAKYLSGQELIGANPDPGRYEGSLVRFGATEMASLLRSPRTLEERHMVEAVLDDGQRLTALNEIYVGHRSHQSARYVLGCGAGEERQSSSGVIVTTGTGAGGWARSIAHDRTVDSLLPSPTDDKLTFFVREAWPSIATFASLTSGILGSRERLTIVSEMEEGGVVFGDGMEHDHLALGWGQRLSLGLADQVLRLAVQ